MLATSVRFTLGLLFLASSLMAQQLITNGGFESGSSGWSTSGDFYIGNLSNPRTGSWYAYVSNANGTPGNNLAGYLDQTFSIPNNITSATLTFWYSITTQDSLSTPHDVLNVTLQPSNTTVLVVSNTTVANGYQQTTFNLTGFAGQTVTLHFLATTNSTLPTVFRVDDVSVTYVPGPTTPPAPSMLEVIGTTGHILMKWQDNSGNESNFEVERKDLGGSFGKIATLAANTPAYEDPQANGNIECYRVRATNGTGVSGYTNEACGTSLAPPNLMYPDDNTSLSNATVSLSWQSALSANRYAIDVGTTCGGTTILNNQKTVDTSYILPVSPGTYVWSVRSENTNYPGVSNSAVCRTFTITSTPSPVASFTWTPQNPKTGETVVFTDTSTGNPTSWTWNFGDNQTSTGTNPSHVYATSGTYTVNLTVSTAGASNSTTRQVTITLSPPTVDFTYTPSSPTTSTPVTFTESTSGGATSFSWDFKDGSTGTGSTITHIFTQAKSYAVMLTGTNSGGSASKTKDVTVSLPGQAPVANFAYTPTSPHANDPITFTDTSVNAPTTWNWNFGDNQTSASNNPTHAYASAGKFHVTLTVTNPIGSDSISQDIIVAAAVLVPLASFTASTTSATVNQTITFADTSTNSPTTWNWNFGDGQTAVTQNTSHAYTTPGTYTVTLTVANAAATSTPTSKTITITSAVVAPVADFTYAPNNPGVGQAIVFADTSLNNPTTWAWSFGDGATSTEKNPTHTFTAAQMYTVTLTSGNTAGWTSKTRTITVVSVEVAPVASFTTSASTATVGQTIQFTDTSTNTPTSWSWDFNDGTSIVTTRTTTRAFSKPGTYRVKLTVSNASGTSSATRDITISASLITIGGSVKTRFSDARIRGGTNHPRAVRLFTANGPTSYLGQLQSDGTYSITATPGTYSAVCTIEYENDIPGYDQPTTRTATARRDGCDGSVSCDIEFSLPIVFLHGWEPPWDLGAPRWTLWRNTVPQDIITFAPHFSSPISAFPNTTKMIEDAAQTVSQQLTTDFGQFTSPPRFNIIAHSKGGLVARVLRSTGLYADSIQTAALLGTPNDGTDCFSFLGTTFYGLSWCDIVNDFNKSYPKFPGDVFVVAGTAGSLCFAEAGPADGVVPVDSVFKITHMDGFANPQAQNLPGVVVAEQHRELGASETWLLTEVVLPYFDRTMPLPDCPASYVTRFSSCSTGPFRPTSTLCLAGRGLSAGRHCTIPAPSQTLGFTTVWQPPIEAGGAPTGAYTMVAKFDPCTSSAKGPQAVTTQAAGPTLLGYAILRSSTVINLTNDALRVGFAQPNQLSFTDPSPIAGMNYYGVTAVYENYQSAPTVTSPVRFDAAPRYHAALPPTNDVPTLLQPGGSTAPGSEVATTTPTFTWTAVSGAQSYGLYVEQQANGGYVRIFDSELRGLNLTDTSYTLPAQWLTRTYRYRWLVRARTATGWREYSSPLYFIVADAGQPDLVPSNVQVKPTTIAPGGLLDLHYDLANKGEGAAPASTTEIHLSTSATAPKATDILLATNTELPMVGGAQGGTGQGIVIPAATPPGAYYLWVVADAPHDLQQTNTANDVARAPEQITVEGRSYPPAGG